jgi:hypothetical protein
MNAYPNVFSTAATEIYYRNQIKRPADRMVFADKGYVDGGAYGVIGCNDGGISVNQNPATQGFFDVPPKRHGAGQPTSFADGHCDYRKWVDKRTIDFVWGSTVDQTCNLDMYWLEKVSWGLLCFPIPDKCRPDF